MRLIRTRIRRHVLANHGRSMPPRAAARHRCAATGLVGLHPHPRPSGSIHLIAASLQTSRHGPLVVVAGPIHVARNPAASLGRIESGLSSCPVVAFVAVGGLLVVALAVLRINDQIILRAAAGTGVLRSGRRLVGVVRRIHDRIAVLGGLPGVVNVVRVVLRNAPEPNRRIVGRQYRDDQTGGRSHHHETGAARRVPDAAAEIIAPAGVIVGMVIDR